VAFVAPFSDRFRSDEELLERTDGWLAPREVLSGHEHIGSVEDRWVCVVARDHAVIGERLTLHDVEAFPWVAPTIRGRALHLHLDGLAAHGIEPRVDVTTDSFAAVPFLVSGTERIGILQESLARAMAESAGLRVLDCPWTVQPLHITFWWSAKREGDVGHAWFREVVRQLLLNTRLQSDG
jgi:DNA-binding transcriptional LysR family regulator